MKKRLKLKLKKVKWSALVITNLQTADKVAEIPMNCKLVNDDIKFVEDLDREWYVEFAKNKIKELVEV